MTANRGVAVALEQRNDFVARGIAGKTSAAGSPTIANTQTTSISVKPASVSVRSIIAKCF